MTTEIKDIAILMHSYHLREHDLITHWFFRNHGLQKAVLKRRNKTPQMLDLYSINELQITKSSSGGDLHYVRSIENVVRFSQCRLNYNKLLISSYLGSLIEYWVDINQVEPELYDLFERALHYINDKAVEWRAITYFERELCRMLGYGHNSSDLTKLYTASSKVCDLRARIKLVLNG